MVKACVVIPAPRTKVYAWFNKPENWAKYRGAAWKSIKVTKRGVVITAEQEGTILRKTMRGTFKYRCSPPEKVEAVWSGSYGRARIKEQNLRWLFREMSGETEVCWSIEAEIPCYEKMFGPGGETILQGLMQKELGKIQKMFQK